MGSLTKNLIIIGNLSGFAWILGSSFVIGATLFPWIKQTMAIIGAFIILFFGFPPIIYNLTQFLRLVRVQVQLRA